MEVILKVARLAVLIVMFYSWVRALKTIKRSGTLSETMLAILTAAALLIYGEMLI